MRKLKKNGVPNLRLRAEQAKCSDEDRVQLNRSHNGNSVNKLLYKTGRYQT